MAGGKITRTWRSRRVRAAWKGEGKRKSKRSGVGISRSRPIPSEGQPRAEANQYTAANMPDFSERPGIIVLIPPYPSKHPVPRDYRG